MPSMQDMFPQYGIYNEHYNNHPAGLPVSQYTPGTNPNKGGASYNAATLNNIVSSALNNRPGTATPTTPATQAPVGTPTAPAGPSTATGTPAPGNEWYNTGMKPTGGFASQYTPAMMDQVYQNPWAILPDVYKGMSQSSPMYQALRDMGADPLSLFNVMKGSSGLVTEGAPDFINWLAEMYGNRGSVGGKNFDAKGLMGALFGQDKFGVDAKNSLGQVLGAGDMSTQIRTLFNLTKDMSNVSMNPLAAKAYQSSMQQAGDQYQSEMMKTPGGATGPVNPSAWIKEHYPSLTLG